MYTCSLKPGFVYICIVITGFVYICTVKTDFAYIFAVKLVLHTCVLSKLVDVHLNCQNLSTHVLELCMEYCVFVMH